MTQNQLFYEDIYEALRTDVMACGGTKAIGLAMWPKLSAAEAQQRVSNCLNRTRSEKFDAEEILFIKRLARQKGSFATVAFEMQDLNMTMPTPIEPEDERARLQREVVKAAETFKQMITRLERLA
jgi:hypothetical protein